MYRIILVIVSFLLMLSNYHSQTLPSWKTVFTGHRTDFLRNRYIKKDNIGNIYLCECYHTIDYSDHDKLLRSTDGGESWQYFIDNWHADVYYYNVATSPGGDIFINEKSSLKKTTDDGGSWITITSGSFNSLLEIDDLSNIYLGAKNSAVLYRIAPDSNELEVIADFGAGSVDELCFGDDGKLFAQVNGIIFKGPADNSFNEWEEIERFNENENCHSITKSENGTLFFLRNYSNMSYSTNNGNSWITIDIEDTEIIAAGENDDLYAERLNTQNIMKTTDFGNSWYPVALRNTCHNLVPVGDNVLINTGLSILKTFELDSIPKVNYLPQAIGNKWQYLISRINSGKTSYSLMTNQIENSKIDNGIEYFCNGLGDNQYLGFDSSTCALYYGGGDLTGLFLPCYLENGAPIIIRNLLGVGFGSHYLYTGTDSCFNRERDYYKVLHRNIIIYLYEDIGLMNYTVGHSLSAVLINALLHDKNGGQEYISESHKPVFTGFSPANFVDTCFVQFLPEVDHHYTRINSDDPELNLNFVNYITLESYYSKEDSSTNPESEQFYTTTNTQEVPIEKILDEDKMKSGWSFKYRFIAWDKNLVPDSSILPSAGGYYLLRFKKKTEGVIGYPEEKIYDYQLFQNYPNPFNPGTIIKFQIKEESNVKLSVFDIKGELVDVIINETISEGWHEIPYYPSSNNKSMPSGVYIYQLEVSLGGNNVYSSSGKMVYIK